MKSSATSKPLSGGVHVGHDTAPSLTDASSLMGRSGTTTITQAIDAYMSDYEGRDDSRASRMAWWQEKIGHLTLDEVDGDHIFFALDELSRKNSRYWAGKDADGKPIFKTKRKPYAPATINRYAATISALFSWCIKRRLSPKGWEHPCKGIERKPENNEVIRFLSDNEREALLSACKESVWPKLYLFVLLALTTGARRGELERLNWSDINFERQEATAGFTKNGDRKILPLLPVVISELQKFKSTSSSLIFASVRCPHQAYNHVPAWKKALKKAKITKFRLHDLRHTCASYLAQDGATLLEIADVLGHRQLSVTKRYSHLTTNHKKELITRVMGNIH